MQTDEELNIKPPFRWSFSQWETYNQCPAKWKYQSVLKLPRKPAGVAVSRGLEIHDSVEKYIKCEITEPQLHEAVNRKYIPILDAYRQHPNGDRYTEKKIAFDSEWNICDTKSKYAACLGVLDATKYSKDWRDVPVGEKVEGFLEIGEWKSGKPKDTHADQRSLYAMFGMKYWYADVVQVTTYYLEDTAPPARLTLKSQAGYEKLKEEWSSRISTMQRDQLCSPRPGFYCRWCDYAKSAGGPCIFS